MWKGFFHLVKKDLKMMLSGRFFLLMFLSLALYSWYINFVYVNIGQDNYHVVLCDPQNLCSQKSQYVTKAESRQALEDACEDRVTIGIDCSYGRTELYMLSSGSRKVDNYREMWGEAVLEGITEGEAEIAGLYNREEKSRREITAEFLFFELSAVGFLGLASVLFKEKQMGVIRVHGILPLAKSAFILSKIGLFFLCDIVFAILLTWLNIGVAQSFAILPGILIQAGILSLIMAFIGFFCAVFLPDFKQFSLFYLVLAVFVTTPVFFAGQTGVSGDFIYYHPMYHLFMAMKSAYFGEPVTSFPFYAVFLGIIALLFCAVCRILAREMTKEG